MNRLTKGLSAILLILSLPIQGQTRDIPEGILKNCDSELSLDQYEELLDLSDTSSFADYTEAPYRTRRIAEIFAEAGDRRGIFASMYVAITDESYRSTSEGVYQNKELAEQLVYVFARRYLGPLHAYLKGQPTEPKWLRYFELAANCRTSPLYVLGTGVNTHLTYDLPHTLKSIGAGLDFEADFMKFGEVLIDKTKESTDLLQSQQGVDASGFFDGFIFGRTVDSFLGERTSAHFIFQRVRSDAWNDFEIMFKNPGSLKGERSVESRWFRRQQVLRFMP